MKIQQGSPHFPKLLASLSPEKKKTGQFKGKGQAFQEKNICCCFKKFV